MRRRAKPDSNQTELVEQLRRIPDLRVRDTHKLGDGFPDICVGYQKINFFFEIKNPKQKPSARQLTFDEEMFKRNWTGQYDVVETIGDCIAVIVNGIEFNHVKKLNVWTQSIWRINAEELRKTSI